MTILKSICFAAVLGMFAAAAAAQDADVPARTDVHPTLITLHVKKVSISSVIADIARQSGMKLQVSGSPEVPVTIDVDQKPFWEVLSTLCDQTHSSVQSVWWGNDGPQLQVQVGFGGAMQNRVVAGPLLATFSRIDHLNQLTAPQATADFCDVQATVMWEPRLALAYYELRSIPTAAVDENGLSLLPDAGVRDPRVWDPAIYESPQIQNGNGTSFQHGICLKVPPQSGRRIAHLTGQIRVWIVDKTEKVTIPDLAAAGKKNPTLKVPNSLTQMKAAGIYAQDQYAQMQLMISKAPGESTDAWEQRRRLMGAIRADIFDPAGKAWSATTQARQFGDQDPAQVYLQIQRLESVKTAPKKAVLEVPVSVTEIDIPYDLKNLPLP